MTVTATAQGKLYLVDAHAYLHRSYHALRLTTSTGRPVGALYGFANMLLGLIKKEKPDFVAVCFDTPGPTFRHQMYSEYKANRKELDEDLKEQLAKARPLAEAMGFKCVEASGFEADDLIATLATRAHNDAEVVLVTPDKDACQLVGKNIRVLRDLKESTFDERRVEEKFGVKPEQIVDYLTIIGDASDNVPGIPGIGPVGAVKLLSHFGSLDKIFKAARAKDKGLTPKNISALILAEQQALVSRDLIRLNLKAPIKLDWKDCKVSQPHPNQLLPLLKELEFKAMIRDLLPDAPESPVAAPTSAPKEVAPLELKAWLKKAASAKRISAAYCSLPPAELLGGSDWALALGLPEGETAWVEPADLEHHRAALSKIFGACAEIVGHDVKPVLTVLKRQNLSYKGKYFDTWLAAYCLNPSVRYDFASVMTQYIPSTPISQDPEPRQGALEQAHFVWLLTDRLKVDLKDKELKVLFEDLETPLIEVLADMEAEGIGLDGKYLKKLKSEFEARISDLKKEIDHAAGQDVNPNSPKQLGKVLFEDLKLPVVHKTPKGGASTDEETLKVLAALHPLPAKLLEYREIAKLQSTYVDGLLERMDPTTYRVHTHFNQAGAATGRLSSLDPNLQNIPIRSSMGQKVRRAFVPREGHIFLSGDYSQIDLRVLAHLSEDPALVEAFRNNEDVHLRTACEVFGAAPDKIDAELRRRAKAVNFGIVYGQTAHGLSQELGIPIGKAKEYIDKYFVRYAGVARWSKSTLEAARRDGFVRTILGRVRYLPDIGAKNLQARLFSERVAVNTPIQGSSADIIKKAMVNIHRKMLADLQWKSRLLLQVHDELLFETPKKEADRFGAWLKEEMETPVALSVPLVVDLKVGSNWQDMKRLGKGS